MLVLEGRRPLATFVVAAMNTPRRVTAGQWWTIGLMLVLLGLFLAFGLRQS